MSSPIIIIVWYPFTLLANLEDSNLTYRINSDRASNYTIIHILKWYKMLIPIFHIIVV